MWKNIFKIIAILIIGAIGGLLFQVLILPYLFTNPYFEKFQFVKILKERKVIVNPKEEIIIQENVALQNAIEKVKNSIVGIKSISKTGKILEGSGLILTSDGLVLTLSDLVPSGWETKIFLDNREVIPKILQRKNNLILLKIEEKNLATVSFADFEKMKLGERIFLIGKVPPPNGGWTVNEGIIKTFNEEILETNIFDTAFLQGSSLFNIDGQLMGLNKVDKYGRVSAISIKTIRESFGF